MIPRPIEPPWRNRRFANESPGRRFPHDFYAPRAIPDCSWYQVGSVFVELRRYLRKYVQPQATPRTVSPRSGALASGHVGASLH